MFRQIPYLQFRSNSIIRYTLPENQNFRTKELSDRLTAILTKQKTYSGVLCTGTKKRLTRALETMVMCKTRHLVFLTLTIYSPDRNINAKEAYKRCLGPFLQWMRRHKRVKMYVWKAELQERGQVHYHLTIDNFIDKTEVEQEWNRLQINAGYVDMSRYVEKFGHDVVPSTKIHNVYNETDMVGYLKKQIFGEYDARAKTYAVINEFSKDIQNEINIGGKVWDCSMNLKAGQLFTTLEDSVYDRALNKAVAEKKIELIATDQCIIYKFKSERPTDFIQQYDKKHWRAWLKTVDRHVDRLPKPPEKEQPVFLPKVQRFKHGNRITESWRDACRFVLRETHVQDKYGGYECNIFDMLEHPTVKTMSKSIDFFVSPNLFSPS